CRWGVYLKSTDEFIGTCGFHYLREKENNITAEVGFDLSKKYWGKGYMSEVMQSVIEFGFLTMNFHTIDATVEQGNERSIALMERLGFIKAATLVDNLIYFSMEKEKYNQ
ncbi:MAG TPA: GNAT family protein, partial [Pseudoneobacillus sp.]|nr:GNAT family protein [Pseudoneobacillus sp.]